MIQSSQQLSEKYLQYFMYQMIKGLAYMHACNVLHRDMVHVVSVCVSVLLGVYSAVPCNVLVNKNCELKLLCVILFSRSTDGVEAIVKMAYNDGD